MTETSLPPVFKDLERLLNKKAGTIARAEVLTDLLLALPDLSQHIAELRRQDINAEHEKGMTFTAMAPALRCKPERVSAIARKAPNGQQIKRQNSEKSAN